MNQIPLKQVFRTALITTPLIALVFVTPVFLLTNDKHSFNFFYLLFAVSIAVLLAWLLNLSLILFVKKSWVLNWKRIFVVGAVMYFLSYLAFFLFEPSLSIDITKIEIIRLSNILAVNTIIYILTNLILSKENESKYALENAHLKLVNLEAEYKLLKDQINPHFLFNALGTAKALIRKQPQLAEEYIVRLSEFLRASINNSKKAVPLKEEIELCYEFIALNKIRFGEAITFKTDKLIEKSDNYVPYFSILSLIENAIKHNSFTIERPLNIELRKENDFLILLNNKQAKFVLENSLHTGLRNLNDRYKLLANKEIVIEDEKDYFLVKIPLLNK